MRQSIFLVMALTVISGCISGCVKNPPPISAAEAARVDQAYRLDAGDRIRVTVYNEPNLTGEYNITTAGNIAFPLVGVIPVKGGTIEIATDLIRAKLADGFVRDPRVSVEVLTYRPFYILGEVAKPGEYAYSGGITVEQAIAGAGGFSYRANQRKVFLRRGRLGNERTVRLRDLPIPVLPGDTIRVGERYF